MGEILKKFAWVAFPSNKHQTVSRQIPTVLWRFLEWLIAGYPDFLPFLFCLFTLSVTREGEKENRARSGKWARKLIEKKLNDLDLKVLLPEGSWGGWSVVWGSQVKEERFRTEFRFLPIHVPTPELSRAARPQGLHCGSGVLLEHLNQIPVHIQEAGWAPAALGVTASGAPGAGAGLGISQGSCFAGRVFSLRSPPRGATRAWGTQGLPMTSGGSWTPPPWALSFCSCRDGQGTLRVESTPGWAGLPRAKGPQKPQPCLDTPEPPPSSSHPSLGLHGDWHRSGLMGPSPRLGDCFPAQCSDFWVSLMPWWLGMKYRQDPGMGQGPGAQGPRPWS